MTTDSTTHQSNHDLAGHAAESADAAIRSARQRASAALGGLSETMRRMKDQAATLVDKVRPQLESVTSYAKEEPTKALLIAAAAGAGVMALIALLARSGGGRMPSARSLRNAAESTANEWRKAATDRTGSWRKSASEAAADAADRADNAMSQATGAMHSTKKAAQAAYDGLSETMQDWKEQAASVAERVRPQIETVTNYAKDDPAKALLIAAAAGAALMGLMSAIGR